MSLSLFGGASQKPRRRQNMFLFLTGLICLTVCTLSHYPITKSSSWLPLLKGHYGALSWAIVAVCDQCSFKDLWISPVCDVTSDHHTVLFADQYKVGFETLVLALVRAWCERA